MKANWFLLVIAGLEALLWTERTFGDSVVYDNTATYLGTAQPRYIEDGSEITLAGTERVVTAVAIVIEAQGKVSAAFTARLSLYVNDGHFPGTCLWQSGDIPQQIEPGGPRFIRFAVPGVRVPDTFIWTAQFRHAETQVSLSQFYPPVVGSVRYGYWWYNFGPTIWNFIEGAPFGAVVTVQPGIPVVSQWGALLMTLALVGAGAVIITRANRIAARSLDS